jgi:hypothetical protein
MFRRREMPPSPQTRERAESPTRRQTYAPRPPTKNSASPCRSFPRFVHESDHEAPGGSEPVITSRPQIPMESERLSQIDGDSEESCKFIPRHILRTVSLYAGFENSGDTCRSSKLITGPSCYRYRKSQLTSAKRSQICFGTAAAKVDFKVVGWKIGWRFSCQEGSSLTGKVRRIFGASDGTTYIHHAAVTLAVVLILYSVHHVRMPEHRVARLHQRD